MTYVLDDTIAAVASPLGGAARGVIRLSGPDVVGCLRAVFQPEGPIDVQSIRRPSAVAGSVLLDDGRSRLPCDVYLWPTGRSYTGQPAAEIHSLGSRPLLDAALRAVLAAGARLAERGEFTLRAFLSGRLDLTQAEAVLGVIDAHDGGQFAVALAQLAGGLAGPLGGIRDELLDLLAHLEAGFDFADEDIEFITPKVLDETLHRAAARVDELLRKLTSRAETGELVRVVLVGWPNSGKSSLLNALTGRAGALVSHHPGTTRDYLTAEIDLGEVTCLLVDTAGIEPDGGPADEIRTAAQAAASEQSRRAAVRVLCLDSTRPLVAWERAELDRDDADRLVVLTKTDLPRATDFGGPALATSAVTGEGLDPLRARLRVAALAAGGGEMDVVAGTAVRCRESLRTAGGSLGRARELVRTGGGEELVAAEVRVALDELGKVVGAVYTDDVLDRIFSRFCIGK